MIFISICVHMIAQCSPKPEHLINGEMSLPIRAQLWYLELDLREIHSFWVSCQSLGTPMPGGRRRQNVQGNKQKVAMGDQEFINSF